MKFHLAHIVPDKMHHGMHGYKEIVDTVQWGLEQLGHSVVYGLNTLSAKAINIIFGVQVLDLGLLETLPADTIVYNFEQAKGWSAQNLRPQMHLAAQRFCIWDYSAGNAGVWTGLGAKRVHVVPIGYAPVLQRIPKPPLQDIDVLIYGSPANDRLGAFHHLAMSGLTSVFVCGLYGATRDDLIARAKLIVNIHNRERSKIFEIVRVSYLLANRKAVVAELDADSEIDDDMRAAVKVATAPPLVNDCRALVADDAARAAVEEAGFAIMARRDIRPILRQACEATLGV
jgi:hypothetical protein